MFPEAQLKELTLFPTYSSAYFTKHTREKTVLAYDADSKCPVMKVVDFACADLIQGRHS